MLCRHPPAFGMTVSSLRRSQHSLGYGCVIMIEETEPSWVRVTGVLADYLSGLEPFEGWAPRLVVAAGSELLYERQTDQLPPN